MRFHITYSPLGSLLAYHLRQALPPFHPITLIYASRTEASTAILKNNRNILMEHEGALLFARNIRCESLLFKRTRSFTRENQKAVRKEYQQVFGEEGPQVYQKTIPEPDEDTPIDSLIITSRPAEALQTIKYLTPRLSIKSTIVLMHTGLGVFDRIIAQLFPNADTRPHFILANSRHHVWLKALNHTVHTRVGNINFAIVPDPKGRDFESTLKDPKASRMDQSLSLRDIVDPQDDPLLARYATLYNTVASLKKLRALRPYWIPMDEGELLFRRDTVVHSIVEALAVWLNCRNGEVLSTEEASDLAYQMCKEATAAFKAQWHHEIKANKSFASNTSLPMLPRALSANSLMSGCTEHSYATQTEVSPMLRDLRSGSPTQIEYGLGFLLAVGRAYNIHMPMTWSLYKMIKAREAIICPVF